MKLPSALPCPAECAESSAAQRLRARRDQLSHRILGDLGCGNDGAFILSKRAWLRSSIRSSYTDREWGVGVMGTGMFDGSTYSTVMAEE